jgi:hypothetical protein
VRGTGHDVTPWYGRAVCCGGQWQASQGIFKESRLKKEKIERNWKEKEKILCQACLPIRLFKKKKEKQENIKDKTVTEQI